MTGPFDMTSAGDARNAGSGCERFDELLPDYLEGSLSPSDLASAESHVAACGRCAALVADLGDLRGTAAALPVLTPSRDLWDGISARIAAPVIPIEVRDAGARSAVKRRTVRWTPAWLGAAAAALVAVTASVTYQLTVSGTTTTVAVADGVRPAPAHGADTAGSAAAATVRDTAAAGAATLAAAPRRAARPGGAAVRQVGAPAARMYDSEIASLRTILDQRRASLSPETVEVLDLNLKIIDQAIAQSRAALAKDPASDFLDRQLDMALEKKLELLRTAALLPAT
jgi:hypothetical protein